MPVHGEKIKKRRDPSMPKGRQLDDLSHQEVLAVIGKLPIQRDLLIEALHLLQDNFGCLEHRHLRSLAEIFSISQAEVYEVASFYHHFDIVAEGQQSPPSITLRICDGLSCEMEGSPALISSLEKDLDLSKVRIQKVPCIGRCANAPAAQVGKRAVDHASTKKILRVLKGSLGPIIPNYQNLNNYISQGGYSCLENIIEGKLSFDQAISILEKSGLRGLGGAGFPAYKKWQFVKSYKGPRLMCINADEGEPGTFKDRYYLNNHWKTLVFELFRCRTCDHPKLHQRAFLGIYSQKCAEGCSH